MLPLQSQRRSCSASQQRNGGYRLRSHERIPRTHLLSTLTPLDPDLAPGWPRLGSKLV
jgi:hypothetical protein